MRANAINGNRIHNLPDGKFDGFWTGYTAFIELPSRAIEIHTDVCNTDSRECVVTVKRGVICVESQAIEH